MICKLDRCKWYSQEAKPGYRKCYYGEPACWRGWLDIVLALFHEKWRRF